MMKGGDAVFNRSGFNQTPFNVPAAGQSVVEFAADFRGSGRVESQARVTASGVSGLRGVAHIDAKFTRTITAAPAAVRGAGRVESVYVRYLIATPAAMRGAGRTVSEPRRFRRETITFDGSFPPGSEVVIDLKRLIVTQDQVNALRRISGDLRLLRIMPGNNNIRYTDTASSRQVRIRVTHKDRFK